MECGQYPWSFEYICSKTKTEWGPSIYPLPTGLIMSYIRSVAIKGVDLNTETTVLYTYIIILHSLFLYFSPMQNPMYRIEKSLRGMITYIRRIRGELEEFSQLSRFRHLIITFSLLQQFINSRHWSFLLYFLFIRLQIFYAPIYPFTLKRSSSWVELEILYTNFDILKKVELII